MGGGRTQEGFWELKGQREVWGTAPGNFLISMLFFFTYIKIFFISFGSLLPPHLCAPPIATLLCLYISLYLQMYLFIHPSIFCPYNFDSIPIYLPIFLSFYLFLICLSTYFYFVLLDLECKISPGSALRRGDDPLRFLEGDREESR